MRTRMDPARLGCFWVGVALLIFGSLVAIPMIRAIVDGYRVARFEETQCTITGASLRTSPRGKFLNYYPRFSMTYVRNGRIQIASGFAVQNYEDSLTGDRVDEIMKRYQPGAVVPCYADPKNPSRVVLTREFGDRRRLFILIPSGGAIVIALLIFFVLIRDRR